MSYLKIRYYSLRIIVLFINSIVLIFAIRKRKEKKRKERKRKERKGKETDQIRIK